MKYLLVILLSFYICISYSQTRSTVQILKDSIKSSFRGLSVPADDVVWVSGSNGTVGKSLDGGTTWKWITVAGFEKRDFRDIEAFDSLTAIIMAVDNPADILKTTDGGKNWKTVYHKEQEGMFLDAMDFNGGEGVCIGDPVKFYSTEPMHFWVVTTKDSGNNWTEENLLIASEKDEAIFAGSGTNIIMHPQKAYNYVFITGGSKSYLRRYQRKQEQAFYSKKEIPIIHGGAAGAFSITGSNNHYYITGGDYVEYWKDSGNVVYTTNAGTTWKHSSVHGYRSCIIQTDKKTFITCGTNGVDISFDGCKTFQLIYGDGAKGKNGFNVCAKSKTGKAVYFAGSGQIGKLKTTN